MTPRLRSVSNETLARRGFGLFRDEFLFRCLWFSSQPVGRFDVQSQPPSEKVDQIQESQTKTDRHGLQYESDNKKVRGLCAPELQQQFRRVKHGRRVSSLPGPRRIENEETATDERNVKEKIQSNQATE